MTVLSSHRAGGSPAVGGNVVSDAHLAALSLEHRGQVVTDDTDFARFDGVDWDHPTPLQAG